MQTSHPFSWSALLRIVLTGVALYFIWKATSIIVVILIATMLATALYPIVMKMSKKIPLALATALTMLFLLTPFFLIGITAIPSVIHDFPNVVKTVTTLIHGSNFLPEQIRDINLSQYAQNAGTYILRSTGIITNIVTSLLIILFLTFYLIVDGKQIISIGLGLLPKSERTRTKDLLNDLAEINGQYIRGNLLISLICGIIMYVGLTLLHIPYALPIALFTAIMDLLPLVGSTIGMIPALIIGFSISPFTGILVLALYIIYQQLEGAVIAPHIYNKALKLSPALGFLSVIIGSALFGIVGAFLALPFAASLPEIITYLRNDSDTPEEIKKQRVRSLKKSPSLKRITATK